MGAGAEPSSRGGQTRTHGADRYNSAMHADVARALKAETKRADAEMVVNPLTGAGAGYGSKPNLKPAGWFAGHSDEVRTRSYN